MKNFLILAVLAVVGFMFKDKILSFFNKDKTESNENKHTETSQNEVIEDTTESKTSTKKK